MTAKTERPRSRGREPEAAGGDNRHNLRILNAIRQIIRAADVDSRQLASEHQITSPQLMCLLAVVEKGEATATDIANRIHLSPSTLVGVLDRLESKGLIKRDRDPEDRRRIWVKTTPEGRALAAKTPFPLQYSLDKALKQLTESQRNQLAAGMERLVELMGAGGIEPAPMLEIIAVRQRQERLSRRS
jgi:DNA-binding MarR family transcriptional regulator